MAIIFLVLTLIVHSFGRTAESARILALLPHHGESHFTFFRPILKALDVAGHQVHVVGHFPMHNASERYVDFLVDKPSTTTNSVDLEWFKYRPSFGHFMEFFMLRDWGRINCDLAYQSAAVKQLIADRPSYDLILMETFNSDCMLGLAHHIGAPVIGLSSSAIMPWQYARMGLPATPSLTPALFMGYSEKMTYRERLANWLAFYGMKFLYSTFSDADSNEVIAKYIGPDVPDVAELAKRTAAMFVNQHYSLSGAKQLPASVIELGGIHIDAPKQLDKASIFLSP